MNDEINKKDAQKSLKRKKKKIERNKKTFTFFLKKENGAQKIETWNKKRKSLK